jgi:N-acetylmuramoyl-L-alanine amidase
MKIAIIPGHGHRQRGGAYRWDPGAVSELGEEADIVRKIAEKAKWFGHGRVTICDSDREGPWSYTSRRNAAHAAIGSGPGVVCHLHVNAGGGDYLLALYDPRSSTGRDYAERWAVTIAAELGLPPKKVKVRPADRGVWNHAANLIEPSYSATPAGVAAVLLEVGFIDTPGHSGLLTGAGIDLQAAAICAAWE